MTLIQPSSMDRKRLSKVFFALPTIIKRWGPGYNLTLLIPLATLLALFVLACGSREVLTPASDERFGVIVLPRQNPGLVLNELGLKWYHDYGFTADAPQGAAKMMKVPMGKEIDLGTLTAAARARPGSFWAMGNEPNVPGQDNLPPEEYAIRFYSYVRAIKGADPSAIIVAPEILNFTRTCGSCSGFTRGREWLEGFRRTYQERYGEPPPIEIWSIHTYDLNWDRLPQGDAQAQIQEIIAFRSYLDRLPEAAGKPIWLTEFSVVWAYPGITWRESPAGALRATPEGVLDNATLETYLKDMLQWLKTNGRQFKVERWFLFSSHPYTEPWATAPGGIWLMEDTPSGPRTTSLGNLYRKLARERP